MATSPWKNGRRWAEEEVTRAAALMMRREFSMMGRDVEGHARQLARAALSAAERELHGELAVRAPELRDALAWALDSLPVRPIDSDEEARYRAARALLESLGPKKEGG